MTAVAIFVKTPGRSPIKTRLAATLGETAALAWYRAAIDAVASVVQVARRPGFDPAYFAVAESDALDEPCWSSLPRVAQGDGGLGERMARVHSTLVARHGAALLLGADCPLIEVGEVREALLALDRDAALALLGPARDGGFWLFGANRTFAPKHWSAVSYSQADTARDFEATLRRADADVEWRHLGLRGDVDVVEDLVRLVTEAPALVAPTAAQARCLDLSRTLVPAR